MKTAISWMGGGAATCILMMLLSLMTLRSPDGQESVVDAARPRVLLRAPPTPAPPTAAAVAPAGGRGGAGAGSPQRGSGKPAGNRATAAAAARAPAIRPLAPLRAAARDRASPIAWSVGTAWSQDSLPPIPLAIGGAGVGSEGGGASGASEGGFGAGGGAGAGGGGRGTGGGAGVPVPAAPRKPPGTTRGVVAVHTPQPAYPAHVRSREESGTVEALIRIDSTGRVTSVDVTGGTGHAALEDAVRSTVMRWQFQPALRDGEPRAATIRRRFEFRMVDR
jgi:TonB family protein